MIVDEFKVLNEAVERGVGYGIRRAFKYWNGTTMSEEQLRDHQDRIVDAVVNEICEWFEFQGDRVTHDEDEAQ